MRNCRWRAGSSSRNRERQGPLAALGLLVSLLAQPSLAATPVTAGIYQNPPKIFLDSGGNPAGFFVDLLNGIAEVEGWEVDYVPCAWNECLAKLERGELDLMADVAYTAERASRFAFQREVVFSSWSVLYAKPGSGMQSVLDLQGRRVAVLRDSVQQKVLQRLTQSYNVSPVFVEVASFEEGYALVESGDADSIAVNRFYGKLHETTYSARPTSILLAPALVKFAASNRAAGTLIGPVDRALTTMKGDEGSVYHRAFKRWFEPTHGIFLPQWLQWLLIAISVIVLVSISLALVLRRMVKRKTLELEQNKSHLEKLSYFDPLTGLPNRVLLVDRLEQVASRPREDVTRLAVFFIDLDEFKQINDSMGHEVGDAVLAEVAKRFTASVRVEDTVARLGGDEFAVVIRPLPNETEAAAIAGKLIDALHEPITVAEHAFYLTASIGISLLPQDGHDAQELLRNADAAMYRAKEHGRNTYRFYTQEMTEQARERVSLVTSLREGLERDEFFLHYQPLVDLGTQRVVGVEALARWNHPTRGLVPPDRFIGLAEESGMIFALGALVLEQACAQMVVWRKSGIALDVMSINLSGRQIRRGDIVDTIRRILTATGCDPSWIELEVTEGFIMSEPEQSIPVMEAFREMGIQLAIDDFGTGHSSLAYLKKLPLSKLKIDRSFVRDIPDDPNDAAIARAVIALGGSLGLTVLAEGIETDEQLRFLRKEGCDEGQGFYFGRPVPAQELVALMSSGDVTDSGHAGSSASE